MRGSPSWPGLVSRLERFPRLDSTQRVVREWLDCGVPEVCLAVADEQTAGRGRLDRRWIAPPGAGLLVSAGMRPAALAPRHAWRLPALASMAMLEAIEAVVPAVSGTLGLKWPNDLVARQDGSYRKVGGVLGDAVLEGPWVASAVVGLGINVDWPASAFPPALADRMTSLHELAGGQFVDRDALLQSWLQRLEGHYAAMADGAWEAQSWADLQVTDGARVEVDLGGRAIRGVSLGTDADSGGLLVASGDAAPVIVLAGDVVRCEVG